MTAAKWKPGDVALIPTGVRGDWQIALRGITNDGWFDVDGAFDADADVREARPLVVIDPEDAEQVQLLATALATSGVHRGRMPASVETASLADALRTLIAPPKPDEPMGLGAVVEDAQGADWHRTRDGRWIAEDGFRSRAAGWVHIDAVKVLSDGVTA